jgi:hypothetical protein
MITCTTLTAKIAELQPELTAAEVARICLLILNQADPATDWEDPETLRRLWKGASLRLKAAADQHAAMMDELDQLCGDGPVRFSPDQIWTLLRAVKTQSQTIELFTGEPAFSS